MRAALAELEERPADSDAVIATHRVALCKELGGGWRTDAVTPAE